MSDVLKTDLPDVQLRAKLEEIFDDSAYDALSKRLTMPDR